MRIYIIIYILMYLFNVIVTPFIFGEKKSFTEFNPIEWLVHLVFDLPIIYFLFKTL